MKKLTTNNKVNSSKYINDNNKKYFLTALEWNDVVDNINDIIDAIETSVVPSLPSEQQTGSYGQLTNSILSIRSEMEGLNSRLITATLNILRIDNSLLNLTQADVVDGHAIVTETDPTVKNWAKNDIYVNSLLLSDISRIEIGSGLTVNVNNSIATVSCVPQGITLAQLTNAIDSVQEDISARINSLLQQINTISGSGSLSGNELPTEPLYIYVEVSSAGWKTYITDNNVLFEPNTAYIVTSIDTSNNNTPVLTSITQAPAGTPLLLLGAGQKQLTVLTSTPAPITNNMLSVGTGLPYQTGEYPYVLALLNGNVSFTLWEGSASDLEGRVVLILNLDYSGNSQNENPSSGGGNEPSQGGDDTPSGSGDTPSGGNDNPSGGDTPSGGDSGQGSGSGSLQPTSYGHWEVKEGSRAWQTATELEYYGADASNYQVKFVPATGIEDLTVGYFGWDPSLAENERTLANRQDIGSDSASVTGLINYVTVNVSTGVVTLPDSTINNGSSNAETMETITIGANVKVNNVTQGDPILFDIKVKRKKVSFRFSSSTGNVFDSTAAGSRVIEMPDIQIQKGADAEWINIEDDDSDYFKGEIHISRPTTDTDVIRLNNEAINNINTAYKVTIPYNDAKDPDFWSNLIEVIDSGQCVLSMNWGPYDQYTFASTQHVTVTSEYRGNAPTPPSNNDMY